MDTVKNDVKATVQQLILDTNWNTFSPNVKVVGSKVNETRITSSKETAIIIHTPQGARWFIVTVKEMLG